MVFGIEITFKDKNGKIIENEIGRIDSEENREKWVFGEEFLKAALGQASNGFDAAPSEPLWVPL